jgi:hypothetical protein
MSSVCEDLTDDEKDFAAAQRESSEPQTAAASRTSPNMAAPFSQN